MAEDSTAERTDGTDEETVARRVAERCVSLSTTDPGEGGTRTGEFEPLREAFADRTVVGLGEATHGTREFFQLKHRLIAFLVRELDCRVVTMEAAFSESVAIDDYVTHGEGDPVEALDGIHFWTWNTEEVLALLEWLRAFNDERPLEDRVRFYGVDAQHTVGPSRALQSYLGRVDPDYRERVDGDLATLAEGLQPWSTPDDEVLATAEETAETVDEIRDRLAERRGEYVDATSEREYELAVRHAWVLDRAHGMAADIARGEDRSGWSAREQSMAETLSWVLDREDADRAVLWAHNAHLMRGERTIDFDDGEENAAGLGQLLDETYGENYYALGFDFDHGSFQALAGADCDAEGLREWTVDPLEGDTVAAAFSAVDAPAAVLDFETASGDPVLSEWLEAPHERREFGAVFYADERQTVEDAPADRFDGLAFVRETTRAVPVDHEGADESEETGEGAAGE